MLKNSHIIITGIAVLAAFSAGRWGAPAKDSRPSEHTLENPVQALETALSERDTLQRVHRLSEALLGLHAEDLPAVATLLEERKRQLSRENVRLIMASWSRFDAREAFEWARGQPGKWGETLASEAIYAWGFRQGAAPLSALEALDDEEDAELRQRLTASALDGWLASGEHEGASEHIAAIEDPRVRRKRGLILASEVAKDGPEALIQWAESIPEDAANGFKTLAFYNAAAIVTRDDPQRAIQLVETHAGQRYFEGALPAVARRWVRYHDPPELFAWLATLPASEERDSAVGDAFRVWHRRQAEIAERWLADSLPARYLDPAIVQIVRASAQQTPQAAVVWAERLEDPELRRRSLQLAGRQFWRRSPQAAAVWLEELNIPEAAKASIRKGPQRMRPQPTAGPQRDEESATGSG